MIRVKIEKTEILTSLVHGVNFPPQFSLT